MLPIQTAISVKIIADKNRISNGHTQQWLPKIPLINLPAKYSLHMAVNMGICQVELVHGQIEDRILWLWTNDSEYSTNSFYNLVVTAGKTKWEYRFIWQLKIPHTVRVFAFLLLQGRLLTHDVMHYRGIQCDL